MIDISLIGKEVLIDGNRHTVTRWAGNNYFLDNGQCVTRDKIELIDEPVVGVVVEAIEPVDEPESKPVAKRRGRKPKVQ